MEEGKLSNPEKIKHLLNWWSDPDQRFYLQQKSKLKDGLNITAKIPGKYLSVAFDGHKIKTYINSIFNNALNHYIMINNSAMMPITDFRSLYNRVHLFLKDEYKVEIETDFGGIAFTGAIDSPLCPKDINKAFPRKEYSIKRWGNIRFNITLLKEGQERKTFEQKSRILEHENFIDLLTEHSRKEFNLWEENIPQNILTRRIHLLNAVSLDELNLKNIRCIQKDVVLLHFSMVELTRSTIWYKTNKDCLFEANKKYNQYVSKCEELISKFKYSTINLGKIEDL